MNEMASRYTKQILRDESQIPDMLDETLFGFRGLSVSITFLHGYLLERGVDVDLRSILNQTGDMKRFNASKMMYWDQRIFRLPFQEPPLRIHLDLEPIKVEKMPLRRVITEGTQRSPWQNTGNTLSDGSIRVLATVYNYGVIALSYIFPIVHKELLDSRFEEKRWLRADLPLNTDETIYLEYLTSPRFPFSPNGVDVFLRDIDRDYFTRFCSDVIDIPLDYSEEKASRCYKTVSIWDTTPRYRQIETLVVERASELRGVIGTDASWRNRSKSWIYKVMSQWFFPERQHLINNHISAHLDINLESDLARLSEFGYDSTYIPVHDVAEGSLHVIRTFDAVAKEKIKATASGSVGDLQAEYVAFDHKVAAILEQSYFIENEVASQPYREYFLNVRESRGSTFLSDLKRKISELRDMSSDILTTTPKTRLPFTDVDFLDENLLKGESERFILELMIDIFKEDYKLGLSLEDCGWRRIGSLELYCKKGGKKCPWGISRSSFYYRFPAVAQRLKDLRLILCRSSTRRGRPGKEYRINPDHKYLKRFDSFFADDIV